MLTVHSPVYVYSLDKTRAPPIVGFNRELGHGVLMRVRAALLTLLFATSMFAGCFGPDDANAPDSDDLDVGVQTLVGGIFQNVKFSASNDLSVYIPYLIKNPDSGYVQNSTIIDITKGSSVEVSILAPPRAEIALFMIGELSIKDVTSPVVSPGSVDVMSPLALLNVSFIFIIALYTSPSFLSKRSSNARKHFALNASYMSSGSPSSLLFVKNGMTCEYSKSLVASKNVEAFASLLCHPWPEIAHGCR